MMFIRFIFVAALAIGGVAAGLSSARAANLTISETSGGIVFSGDCNFTCNDWGGLISDANINTEHASLSANLYNPNGHAGTDNVKVLDTDSSLSDVISMTFAYTDGPVGVFTIDYCSNDDGNSCAVPETVNSTATENAVGDFNFAVSLDPNMSASASSPEPVPEPASLTLLGAGLIGLALRRRKRKIA